MPRHQRRAAAAVVLALLAACADSARGPARAAIQATESILAAVRAEAEKYAPEQLKAVDEALASAKASFSKGEFKAALDGARELPGKAMALGNAAAVKKAELVKAFQDAAARVPGQLDAVKGRLEELAAARKLPAGLDAATLRAARERLAEASKAWEEAAAEMKAGALARAAEAARAAQQKADQVAALLEGAR
jgi:hypothetical protein